MSAAIQADPLLDRPLRSFEEFGTREQFRFTDGHLATMRDLVGSTERRLLTIPGFGRTSLQHVKQVLLDYGLALQEPDKQDGTLPLPFPSIHERISRIEQRLTAIEQHSLLREVGMMGGMTPHEVSDG